MEYLDTNEPSVAYGILKDLENSSFTHSCNTTFGASGSPIINLETNKVIGIHIGCSLIHNYNIGRFLNNSINDFIKQTYKNKFKENEIKYLINKSTKMVHLEDLGKFINNNNNDNKNYNFSSENNENIIYEKKSVYKNDILSINNNNFNNIKNDIFT